MAQLQQVAGDNELWFVDGKFYVVYFVPGTNPPVPMAWEFDSPEDLHGVVGTEDALSRVDKRMTAEQFRQRGTIVYGTTDEIQTAEQHPWTKFQEEYQKNLTMNPYLADPEIMGLLAMSWIEGRSSISQADLQNTNWYKTHTPAERQFLTMPSDEQAAAIADARGKVANEAKRLGINMTGAQILDIATRGVRYGWISDQAGLSANIAKAYQEVGSTGGALANQENEIRKIASDYGVPVSSETIQKFLTDKLAGRIDDAGIKAYFVEQAKSLYPTLGAALDAGWSVIEYASPYAEIAKEVLDINPKDFNLSDPKWSQALMQVGKDGQRGAMSLADWRTLLKTDPTYGYDRTTGALREASRLSTGLQQMFGNLG